MKLYQHQIDGLKAAQDLNHVAFYWDMGTGKTFVGAEKMHQLGANVNLVICQKSKIQDWMDHFTTYYPDYLVMDLHYDIPLGFKQLISGHTKLIGIINYDLVWRRPILTDMRDFTLLLDESSLIQNESAKRSKFILWALDPKNVILLSGTPTGGKYERLWSQMHLLGWEISKELYWKQFVQVKFLDTVGKGIPIVTGYKNVDRLKRKMAQYGCQFLKTEEVIDLPQQIFQKVRVPVSKEYKVFRKKLVVKIGKDELVGNTTLIRMLYERELCGIYSKEKLEAFQDLLDSTDDRVIVFYNFTAELEALEALCERIKRPYSVINGSVRDLYAYEEKNDSVAFIQYQAGAMGLNLQKACKMVFYTLPLSSELYEQAKKRIHRIGQNRPCFYYQMICTGSIEERILATLNMRKDYTEKLFEKDERNGSKTD